jgi:hypothetical protein
MIIPQFSALEFVSFIDIKMLLIASNLCHPNGIMEYRNVEDHANFSVYINR